MNQAACSLVVTNALLADGGAVDIGISDGVIAVVEAAGSGRLAAPAIVDAAGMLVTPSLIDAHIHLDKTFLGLPFIPHRKGRSVKDRIVLERQIRSELPLSVAERGSLLIERVVPFGTGALRSHVDIDPEGGLSSLEQVLDLKARYAHLVDIQIVAFPQSGVLRSPGVAELLDAALLAGADRVGGLDPAVIDGDISSHLDTVFGLAEKHGVGVDIHLHEPGELGLFTQREIARRTEALGLGGRVAISHAFALGEALEIGQTLEALAEAGVAIVTNAPGAATMPPIKRLHQAGVLVAAGSDNIRDAWSPYGNGDMLDRAAMVGYRQGFLCNEDIELAFAMATTHAAAVLDLDRYGIAVGNRADLMLTDASGVAEAVAASAARRLVIKAGRVVARDGVLSG